jgi:hypothetical protein
LQQHEQITASSTDVHRARLQHMESDLCTCNSQRTAGIDADGTLDGVMYTTSAFFKYWDALI